MMKRIFCVALVLSMVISVGSVCFAAPEDINVDNSTYGETQTVLDEPIPEAGAQQTDITSGLEDSSAQAQSSNKGTLPKTGGIPEEAFYAAGALLIVSALIISKAKARQN